MPTIPEYEIYTMKYAERQADRSTFMLGVEPDHNPTGLQRCPIHRAGIAYLK